MRVLICIPCLLTGGTEIQTLNTVHALVQGGHEVTVACYFEHTPYMVERYRKAGAMVLLFSPEGTRVGGYRAIPYLYKHLRRTIKAVRPDVTHVQYMAPGAMVILLLWLLGVRNIIATAHTAADIYKDLRLIHFLQRHILRAFTCITERAERSFFGSSQLYTTETVLGKRNHFTIYNSLPINLERSCSQQSTVNGQQTGHPGCSQISHTEFTEDTEFSGNADIISHDLDLNSQNARIASLACASGVGSQSHADSTDCTEDICQHDKHSNLDTFTHMQACAALPDEDTQGVYENANVDENNSQFTIDNSQLTISSGAASLNPQPSSIDLNLSCQQDLDTNLDTFTHMQACAALPDGSTVETITDGTSAMSAAPSLRGRAGGEAPILGVVSRLEPIKGMDLVVPAFAEVLKRFPEVRLLVVGDGSLRATMENQAEELGCADRITWVGRQPQEELAQWYGQMDIVLMPSRSEGFGLTAIEAMANGCVVVASEVGGLPEVVHDGVCGLLHRSEDVQDMAEKISALLGDNELYSRLRTQALCEVEKYSFERYAKSICDLYERLKVKG